MTIEEAKNFEGQKAKYILSNSEISNIEKIKELENGKIIAYLKDGTVCDIHLLRDENNNYLGAH